MRTIRGICFFALIMAGVAQFSVKRSEAQTLCATGSTCVTTWQYDNYRTGQNLNESTITYQSIVTDNFGQLCSVALDGQVYAQPLVVTNVQFQGGPAKTVVYVVTQNASVYAIDGTNCSILNSGGKPVSLLVNNFSGQPKMTAVSCRTIGAQDCETVAPTVGVLGTPVIAINYTNNTGTLYVVAESESYNSETGYTYYHFLHALDITTLAEGVGNENAGAPVQICGNGCQAYTTASSFSQAHIQRPGLLLANCGSSCGNENFVYVAFSLMDGTPQPYPNGVILGFNTANLTAPPLYYQTSVGFNDLTSNGGGFWMGGAAPAYGPDASGKDWIYLTTANGTFNLNSGGTDAGDSFVKLDPATLTLPSTGYMTPVDEYFRSTYACGEAGDVDFGSGGVTLIPDHELSGAGLGLLAVNGEKEGGVWFMDRTSPMPGGFNNSCAATCTCKPGGANPSGNVQTFWTGTPYHGHVIQGNSAFWANSDPVHPIQPYLFVGPAELQLTQYPLCAGVNATLPICGGTKPRRSVDPNGAPITFEWGVTPSISASEPESAPDAIVWALAVEGRNAQNPLSIVPGTLYAFDANSMHQLYASSACPTRDQIAPATKFSVPTVANGFVYVGAEELSNGDNDGTGTFYIFGLNSATCGASRRVFPLEPKESSRPLAYQPKH